jgi:hypothetical protein
MGRSREGCFRASKSKILKGIVKMNTKRTKLNSEQVVQIIAEWNQKSIDEFANEFAKAPNTIRAMVYAIRKEDPELCPPKRKRSRQDVVKEAINMYKNDASEDVISDN